MTPLYPQPSYRCCPQAILDVAICGGPFYVGKSPSAGNKVVYHFIRQTSGCIFHNPVFSPPLSLNSPVYFRFHKLTIVLTPWRVLPLRLSHDSGRCNIRLVYPFHFIKLSKGPLRVGFGSALASQRSGTPLFRDGKDIHNIIHPH